MSTQPPAQNREPENAAGQDRLLQSGECSEVRRPHELWAQADREHPDDADARRDRYHELLREHGHLISTEPDSPHPKENP